MTGFPQQIAVRDHFTLAAEYLGWLQAGRKSTTIRWRPGALDLPGDVLPLYSSSNGTRARAGHARVTSVTIRRYADLGHAEAWRDGYTEAAQLREALEGFYPGIGPDSWVTIYGLELLAGGQ